jgi:hypothetical protein
VGQLAFCSSFQILFRFDGNKPLPIALIAFQVINPIVDRLLSILKLRKLYKMLQRVRSRLNFKSFKGPPESE